MKCPLCQKHSTTEVELESGLQAVECQYCGGHWIKSFQYWKWMEAHKENLPEITNEVSLPVQDSKGGKFCPECNKFLVRYKVGHGVNFQLDRCNTCGGTWFDKNEWETLKAKNLHDDVHFIFSAAWQTKVLKEDVKASMEELLKKKLGDPDYAKAVEVKQWVSKHKFKNEILSYWSEIKA